MPSLTAVGKAFGLRTPSAVKAARSGATKPAKVYTTFSLGLLTASAEIEGRYL